MRRFRRRHHHHHARRQTTRQQQQQNSFRLLLVGIGRCSIQDHHSILVDIAAMVLLCLATVTTTTTKSFATAAATTNEICCFTSNVAFITNQRIPTTFLTNNNKKKHSSLFEKTSKRICLPTSHNVLDYYTSPSFLSTTTTTRIFAQSSSTSSNIEASSSTSSMTADIDIDPSTTATTKISQSSSWIHENIESENIGPSTIISSSATEEEGKDDSNKKVTEAPLLHGTTTPTATTTSFPFSLIVGNDLTKKALLLAAANPQGLGSGVLLIGGHGSCKSVLCRSMQQLMSMTSLTTQEDDQKDGYDSNNVAVSTKTVVPPFVTVPLHCQEDALLGSVDLEKSMKEGVAVYEPGLLARAHNGILHIDDIHLLDDSLIHILLTAVSDGYVSIEREGISVKYPCRPIVLASYNPVEGGGMDDYGDEGGGGELLRQHWMDRIAMTVPMTDFSSTTAEMTVEDRVEVVQNVENFVDKTLSSQQIQNLMEEERDLQNTIHTARTILPNVILTKEQLLYLCQEASRADCEGQRGEIYASEIAKTSAALDGRIQVNSEDLKLAVLLAIGPRSRVFTTTTSSSDYDDEQQPPPQQQQQQQPSSTMDQPEQESPPLDDDDPEKQPEDLTSDNQEMDYDELDQENSDQEPKEEEEEPLSIPDHFMFGVDAVPLDPQLLNFQQWTRKGNKGGKRSKIFNLKRGRFVKAIIPKDVSGWKSGKIAVGATLRAAAPYQKIRRERSLLSGIGGSDKPVHIRDVDFRIQRMARKSGSLILFVVDSSGSMALNRMGAAKGAAMSLLNEAYKCRDQICLISFHDTQAEVVVPPTKSMALARNRLEAMPCGGKTPLAHALVTAIRTGMNAVKVKQDVGRVVVVLLADGRANVPLCVSEGETFDAALMDPDFDAALSSTNRNNNGNNLQQQQPSRAFLKEEILALAKQLGSLKEFDLVCVDTEDKFVGAGIAKELTRAASGTYFHLTPSTTTAESVAEIALQGVRHASQGH